MSEINYTITSSDPKNYSIIKQSLAAPSTELTEFLVTGLTTMCSFVLLDFRDYIEFEIFNINIITPNKYRLYWTRTTTNLTYHKFCDILLSLLGGNIDPANTDQVKNSMDIEYNELSILTIRSHFRFGITDMSYRMRMITGMFENSFAKRSYYRFAGDRRINATIDQNDFIEIEFENGVKRMYKVPETITFDRRDVNTYLEFIRKLIKGSGFKISLYYNCTVLENDQQFKITSISNNLKNITGLSEKYQDGRPTTSHETYKYDTESGVVYVLAAKNPRPIPGVPNSDGERIDYRHPNKNDYITFGFDFDDDQIGTPLTIKKCYLKKEHMVHHDSVIIILDILREAVGKDIPGIRFDINENNQFRITLVDVHYLIVDISPLLSELTGFVARQFTFFYFYNIISDRIGPL